MNKDFERAALDRVLYFVIQSKCVVAAGFSASSNCRARSRLARSLLATMNGR